MIIMREISALSQTSADLSATYAVSVISAADELFDDEFLGWTQGGGEYGTVEIIFDYMCPGSKAAITEVTNEDDEETVTIFELFENNDVDVDGASVRIMDAISLRMAPFPIMMHNHVD